MNSPHMSPDELAKLLEKGKELARLICSSTQYSHATGTLTLDRNERQALAAFIARVELQRDTHYVAVARLLQRIRDEPVLAWFLYAPEGCAFDSLVEAVALHKGVSPESIRKRYTPSQVRNPEAPRWHPVSEYDDEGLTVLIATKGYISTGYNLDGKWYWSNAEGIEVPVIAWTHLADAPLEQEILKGGAS